MSQEISHAYIEGFAAKCAEANIDPKELLAITAEGANKQAGFIDALKALLSSGKPQHLRPRDPRIPLDMNMSVADLRRIYGGPTGKMAPMKPKATGNAGNPLINGGTTPNPLYQGKLAPTKVVQDK